MKLLTPPPFKNETRYKYSNAVDDDAFVSAWGVVTEVGERYRGHRSLALECQRDLLRYTAIKGGIICAGIAGERAPFVYFSRRIVDGWLEVGGRAWIIGELEARSDRRVVPFVRKNGGDE